ncbi:MAG: hypothetical protein P1Q69_14915, partial [Candidatus Thorarchaeota archaeon]|nr:hypothetical protein [Candidatus Thorarchaeota archaeon]
MKSITTLVIIVILVVPTIGVGMSCFQEKPEILILTTDRQDADLNLAISTFREQITDSHVNMNVA